MEVKYKNYKNHPWGDDKEWQKYLTNLYPIPDSEKMERFRKKWYKKNIDPAFDITFTPPVKEEKKECSHGMSEQERFKKQFEDKYKAEDPVGVYVA